MVSLTYRTRTNMKSQKEIEYLEHFKTFTSEQKREEIAFALRFLLDLIKERKRSAGTLALDVDVIDGEYTVGDANE